MTQEDKELLLRDLGARLGYGVKIQIPELFRPSIQITETLVSIDNGHINDSGMTVEFVRPYLRPLSSITEDERKEVGSIIKNNRPSPYGEINNKGLDNLLLSVSVTSSVLIDWLNAHHFDYRMSYDADKKKWVSMIEKGLAIEVTESNNPYDGTEIAPVDSDVCG